MASECAAAICDECGEPMGNDTSTRNGRPCHVRCPRDYPGPVGDALRRSKGIASAATVDRQRFAVLSTAVGIARLKLRDGDADGALDALDSAAAESTRLLREFLIADGNDPEGVDGLLGAMNRG